MPCYHPMHAFRNPFLVFQDTGASVFHLASIRERSHVFREVEEYKRVGHKYKYVQPLSRDRSIEVIDPVEIPCGHCLGCRLDQANQWASRIVAEATEFPQDQRWFLTLTYDDSHLKYAPLIDVDRMKETGEVVEIGEAPTVCKKDLQDFWKRLRETLTVYEYDGKRKVAVDRPNLRYYCSLEYGPKSHRPHAHAIVLGLKLSHDQLQFHKFNFAGDPLYKCRFLDGIWQNGFVEVGCVNQKTAGYVARYTMKKMYQSDYTVAQRVADYSRYLRDIGVYDALTRDQRDELLDEQRQGFIFDDLMTFGSHILLEREDSFMSTCPGIGTHYFLAHADELVSSNELWIENRQYQFPRFFEKLLKKHRPDLYDIYKMKRQSIGKARSDLWYAEHPEDDRLNFLLRQEKSFLSRIKKLRERENLSLYDRR